MPPKTVPATDAVEELRLRRWAREHYVAAAARDTTWHAVVLDEMRRRDNELAVVADYDAIASRIVPLVPESGQVLQGPHTQAGEPARPEVLLRVPALAD